MKLKKYFNFNSPKNIMSFSNLPVEILSKIFLYLRCPVAKLIKDEIEIYEVDHNWSYTKTYRKYYIQNIMPFNYYYFDKMREPQYYDSFLKEKMVEELYEQCEM